MPVITCPSRSGNCSSLWSTRSLGLRTCNSTRVRAAWPTTSARMSTASRRTGIRASRHDDARHGLEDQRRVRLGEGELGGQPRQRGKAGESEGLHGGVHLGGHTASTAMG
jgi:hypothetical protein